MLTGEIAAMQFGAQIEDASKSGFSYELIASLPEVVAEEAYALPLAS